MTKKIWMETTRIKPSLCPCCFVLLDAATNVYSPSPPAPGDFTICIQCGSVLQFDAIMALEASSLDKIPLVDRAKFATVKAAVEETRKDWNAKGGKPWCSK